MKTDILNQTPKVALTHGELCLIFELLAGSNRKLQIDSDYLHSMAGELTAENPGAILRLPNGRIYHNEMLCSALEHEILDACNLDGLDTKWELDGVELLHKIRAMSPASRSQLIAGVASVWQKGECSFEDELDQIDY